VNGNLAPPANLKTDTNARGFRLKQPAHIRLGGETQYELPGTHQGVEAMNELSIRQRRRTGGDERRAHVVDTQTEIR
jgi:hypothetical protein